MTERQPEDERDEEDEEDDDESPPPPKAKKTSARKASESRGTSGAPPGPTMVPSSRALAIGIIALIVGGGAGWFGQIQKTKASMRAADAAPAGSGAPSGSCASWQSKICASVGAQSASCQQAKAAAELLMPSTCDAALGTVSETLARVKATRVPCDKLVSKICAELTPDSKTCAMVRERTPSFPRERCDQMLTNYDKVIAELKQMDQQGGPGMGAPGMGGPGMGAPGMGGPGMGGPRMQMQSGAPGGMPHLTIPPQGTAHP